MCGMAGWVSFDGNLRDRRGVVEKMTATMALRGPDDGGIWIDTHVALGHRRLSIIDLKGGTQPMHVNENGQSLAVLVYTGEVYNFAELRSELAARGHRFRTQSDTEVVLRGYMEWGEHVAEHLNGMFAFAIWDTRRQELFLIRDRMGVKPLFYYPMRDGVLFGSEPKAILAHPDVRPRVDAAGLRELLIAVKTPEQAVFSGMYEVRPGQVVRVNRSGISKRRYWQLEAHPHQDDLQTTITTVRNLLEDIVDRQLVSDVPLCTLLSGGLDSSMVTAIAHRATKARLRNAGVRSFSVDFENNDVDDSTNALGRAPSDTPFVREFVRQIDVNHSEIVIDSQTLLDADLRTAVMRARDCPAYNNGDLFPSLYRLFEAVRSDSTVALSGEAADEVFGGYNWFHDPEITNGDTFPWLMGGWRNQLTMTGALDKHLVATLDLAAFEQSSYADAIAEVPVLAGEVGLERRMREMTYLSLTRFVQILLDRKDRMSMAVGLEVRVPFCDHRLVEYAFNMPWSMKSFDGREKSILRAAARDILPDAILERKKSPYPATRDRAYEHVLRERVADMLADRSHPASVYLDHAGLTARLTSPLEDTSSVADRSELEDAAALGDWIKDYKVEMAL